MLNHLFSNIWGFEFSQLILSPLIGISLDRMGRKNTIIIGDIIMIGATIGIGATEYIRDTYAYLGVTIALRFVQGIGAAMV